MFGGKVIHGDKEGRKLGFPTANVDIHPIDTKCREGIYAAICHVQGKRIGGALYVDEKRQRVEVHLLKYSGECIYGEYLEVDAIRKVSDVKDIQNKEALIQKITADVQRVREALCELDNEFC